MTPTKPDSLGAKERFLTYVGEGIRHRRRVLDLTQGELAEQLSVSRVSVSSWEVGKGLCLDRLFDVAEALGCKVTDFLD